MFSRMSGFFDYANPASWNASSAVARKASASALIAEIDNILGMIHSGKYDDSEGFGPGLENTMRPNLVKIVDGSITGASADELIAFGQTMVGEVTEHMKATGVSFGDATSGIGIGAIVAIGVIGVGLWVLLN